MRRERDPCRLRRWEALRHNSSRAGNPSRLFRLCHEPHHRRRHTALSIPRRRHRLGRFTTCNLHRQWYRPRLRLHRTSSNRWRRCIHGHRHPRRREKWSANSCRMDHISGCVCGSLGRPFLCTEAGSRRHRCLTRTTPNPRASSPRLWGTTKRRHTLRRRCTHLSRPQCSTLSIYRPHRPATGTSRIHRMTIIFTPRSPNIHCIRRRSILQRHRCS